MPHKTSLQHRPDGLSVTTQRGNEVCDCNSAIPFRQHKPRFGFLLTRDGSNVGWTFLSVPHWFERCCGAGVCSNVGWTFLSVPYWFECSSDAGVLQCRMDIPVRPVLVRVLLRRRGVLQCRMDIPVRPALVRVQLRRRDGSNVGWTFLSVPYWFDCSCDVRMAPM